MSPIRRLTIAVLISTLACSARSALAKHDHKAAAAHHAAAQHAEHERKKHEEAARKAEHERKKQQERAEHERKHQQEMARKAEHERKQHEAAKKAEHERKKHQEAVKKAEQEKKHQHELAKGPEHDKKLRAEAEARIAARRKARAAKPADRNRQTARDRQIAGTLRKAAVNLHRADHDYDWQRHEAAEMVMGALHDLHEPEPNVDGAFGGMTQKHSDQILRENIPTLEKVKSELSAGGAPANHRAARQKIEEALSNLQAALRIR